MLEVALQVEDERLQWNEDRTRRWEGSRLFGQRIRSQGHPESFSSGKIDEDGPELFPPDHLRGNRSRAAPAKGRGGLGGERRGEPLSAHEGEDELSVVDHLVCRLLLEKKKHYTGECPNRLQPLSLKNSVFEVLTA